MAIKICKNGHITGYRNCPMCAALAEPQQVTKIMPALPRGTFKSVNKESK